MVSYLARLILTFTLIVVCLPAWASVRPPDSSPNEQHASQTANQNGDSATESEYGIEQINWLTVITFFLAFFTFGLWRTSVWVGKRQLRAYVALDSTNVVFKKKSITITLNFINAGQTPAHDLYVNADVGIYPKDVRNLSVRPIEQTPDKRVIGPGRIARHTKIIRASRAEIKAVKKSKRQRGFIWGHVIYRDAFKCLRRLDFNYRTALSPQGRWIMQPTLGGEKAK